jgi:uncharacterized protein YkwD
MRFTVIALGSRMRSRPRSGLIATALLAFALGAFPLPLRAGGGDAATAPIIAAARYVRSHGCPGGVAQRGALSQSGALDGAAARWASGVALRSAVQRSSYREEQSAALHVNAPLRNVPTTLAAHFCRALTDPRMRDIGVAQQGRDSWIIVAEPFRAPPATAADAVDAELLRRINQARTHARRCGSRVFAAAPPLRLDSRLVRAADAHAEDMIERNYFAHLSPLGITPAQRVAATGYHYRLVGENIASGPETAAEAVEGWLASPEHCENIMDPRFVATGIGFAANQRGAPRIEWVQDFAAPL